MTLAEQFDAIEKSLETKLNEAAKLPADVRVTAEANARDAALWDALRRVAAAVDELG